MSGNAHSEYTVPDDMKKPGKHRFVRLPGGVPKAGRYLAGYQKREVERIHVATLRARHTSLSGLASPGDGFDRVDPVDSRLCHWGLLSLL
jgi:hypothetical protein